MEVTWEIEDGYCGGSRPQTTEVPDDELDECETESDCQTLIDEYVQADFENTVSWCITAQSMSCER